MTETATRPVVGTLFRLLRANTWLLLVLALGFAVAWFRLWSPVEVSTVRVERGLITSEAFGRGTIESEREAAVGFDLIGRISEVLVEEGARVTMGQELARLETDQAEADLRSARTGIGAARASLQRIAAEESRARALLDTAEREAARAEALISSGAISAQQRDDASGKLQVARADLDRVLAQRSEATRGIDVASGGAEQRRVAIVRATLLAPFDGLVTRRLRDPGDTVAIGSTVLRIVDTSQVHVTAAIDETILDDIALDQIGSISFPGSEALVAGRVSKIGWESDRQTHELLVEVTPNVLERRIAIGQRADVRIELARAEQALLLPTELLHRDDGGTFVYVDRGQRISLVRPRFGLSGTTHVQILDGLNEGDIVLSAPANGATLPVGRRWRAQ